MKLKLVYSTAVLSAFLLTQFSARATDFDSDLEKTFQVSAGDTFVLDADQGSCDVTTSGTDKVQIKVLRKAKNASQSQADELFANHQVTFNQDGGKVSIVAKNKSRSSLFRGVNPPWLDVRYVIEIPKKFDVDLKTAGGDVRISSRPGNGSRLTFSFPLDHEEHSRPAHGLGLVHSA